MAEKELNYFEQLNNVDVSGKTEKKNNLTREERETGPTLADLEVIRKITSKPETK